MELKQKIVVPDLNNYYKDQLNRIDVNDFYPPKIQLSCTNNKTNWINLNKDSATELVKWLTDNFIK